MGNHTVYVARFTPKQVEVPTRCPKCDANLMVHGALIESNWMEVLIPSHRRLTPEEGSGLLVEPEGEHRDGCEFYPVALSCARCDWAIDAEAIPEGLPS